jgi:hypothetical protein
LNGDQSNPLFFQLTEFWHSLFAFPCGASFYVEDSEVPRPVRLSRTALGGGKPH